MSALRAPRRSVVSTSGPGPVPVIETARLVLRPHRLDDAEAIATSLGDFAVARMLTRVPVPYDRQDGLDWLNMVTSGLNLDWSFAITLDDIHVGVVSIELRHGTWHLGYWLNRFYWGRGLMTEAVDAALEYFFRRMPAVEITVGAFTDNQASLRLLERRGCRIVGVTDVYSRARNAMARLIDMRLAQADFAARRVPT